MNNMRNLKIWVPWAAFSILLFYAGWIGGRHSMRKIVDQTTPRFIAPRQKTNDNMEFNVGIECPPGYGMEFIALKPKEENEFNERPDADVWNEIDKRSKRTNKLLDNAVCVKGAER